VMNSSSHSHPVSVGEAEPTGRKLYVVCGTTGEYSDRGEWTTWAFDTEAEARAYVEFLAARRQEIGAPEGFLDWEQEQAIEAAMRSYDPRYSEDYTGTRWFVSAVDYGPTPPPSETPPPRTADREAGVTADAPRDELSQPETTGES
jgi:hypothetical protein